MTEWFESGERWYPSKWGPDDELGTLNVLTAQKTLSALKLVKSGRVYRLGHQIFSEMPARTDVHGPFFYLTSVRPYDYRPPIRKETRNKFGAAHCRVEMVDHLGTHMDSLNHIAFDNKFYNGVDAFGATTPQGTLKLGIDSAPPIVTKGLMIDVAALKGKEILNKGYSITVDDTERFLRQHNMKIEQGDAIFFHTGPSKLWMTPEKYEEYFQSSPGVGYDLAKWLAEKDVVVVGADNPVTEVTPSDVQGTLLPVHQYLITKSGIRIIDNMKLDELSLDRVYEFLFVCSQLPIKGATASPVAPLALT
jgi:kynurenine formamidase